MKMKRRKFILNTLGAGIMALPASTLIAGSILDPKMKSMKQLPAGPARPLTIYDNWSAYDELSDNIFLTEELAMKELNELLRLKRTWCKIRLLRDGCFLV